MDYHVQALGPVAGDRASQINQIDYLAEIISPTIFKRSGFYAGLTLMVWILKREVRAFGGCLGMYRR